MAGGEDLAFGLATSVGPLPSSSASDAVELSLRLHPRFPAIPVLDRPDATLLAQAVAGIDGLSVLPAGPGDEGVLAPIRVLPDPADAIASAQRMDLPAFDAVHAAVAALSALPTAPAAVRVPVLGPASLAFALRAAGAPADEASQLAAAVVAARAVALQRIVRRACPTSVTAVVLGEPGLVGSAHPTFPLLPAQIRGMLDPVVDALDGAAAADSQLIGIHVPGPADWPTVVSSGASLVCVPVDRSILGWASLFGDLLDRGGRICWGAVPVDRPIGTSEDPHWRRLVGVWTSLVADGVDPMLLRLRSSFSPADGLAHFGPTQAELVMGLTAAVAELVHHQAVAARLSLGA